MNNLSSEDRVRGCLIGLMIGERGAEDAPEPRVFPRLQMAMEAYIASDKYEPGSFVEGLQTKLKEAKNLPVCEGYAAPFWVAPAFALAATAHGINLNERNQSEKKALTLSVMCISVGMPIEFVAHTAIMLEFLVRKSLRLQQGGIQILRPDEVTDLERANQLYSKDPKTFSNNLRSLANHDMLESPLMLFELYKDPFFGALATYLRNPNDPVRALGEAAISGKHAPLIGSFIGAMAGQHLGLQALESLFDKNDPIYSQALTLADKFIAAFK